MEFVILMEYCEGGELLKYVQNKGRLQEEETKIIFSQIAEAVYYLHREKLIHRDMKLENILFANKENKLIKVSFLFR